MEYNIDAKVISSLLETKDFEKVIDNRITADYFHSVPHRQAFRFIERFWKEYGKVPEIETVMEEVPTLELVPAPEPLEHYLSELRSRKEYITLVETIQGAYKALQSGWASIPSIKKSLEALVIQLQEFRPSKDKDIHADVEGRIERYLARQKAGGVVGVPTPWPTINMATGGWSPGQLITVMGESGIGKTFFLLMLAIKAEETGYKPLFISREMDERQIEDRYDALRYKLPFAALKAGQLSEEDYQKYLQAIKEQAQQPGWIVSVDDDRGFGISSIQAKIERYQPTIVFIDGGYLLDDEQGAKTVWERQTNITRGLKRLASRFEVPIVVATQANREGYDRRRGPTKANVAYSLSWLQDSDVVIALYQNKTLQEARQMQIRLVKVRDGPTGVQFMVKWDFQLMEFGEIEASLSQMDDEDADVIDDVFDEEGDDNDDSFGNF